MAKNQQNAVSRTQSIISGIQSGLDDNSDLRAELSEELEAIEIGSNGHLLHLLEVVSDIEDEVNMLLCDLETIASAMEIYSVAGSSCQRGEFHLSDIVSVVSKLLPDHSDWDRRLHQHFTRLHAMKRGLAHH